VESLRIVLDTSVIVAVLFNARSADILRDWRRGLLILCTSPDILGEYTHILTRIPPIRRKAKRFLTELSHSESVDRIMDVPRIRVAIDDPTDRKFIACAVGADAHYLISLDRHLLTLKSHRGIPIIRPSDFLRKWRSTNRT